MLGLDGAASRALLIAERFVLGFEVRKRKRQRPPIFLARLHNLICLSHFHCLLHPHHLFLLPLPFIPIFSPLSHPSHLPFTSSRLSRLPTLCCLTFPLASSAIPYPKPFSLVTPRPTMPFSPNLNDLTTLTSLPTFPIHLSIHFLPPSIHPFPSYNGLYPPRM